MQIAERTSLAALILIAVASPVYGNIPFALEVAYTKITQWWTIPATLIIEAAVLRLFFGYSWLQSAWASVAVNVVTGLVGFVIYPVMAPIAITLAGVGSFIEVGVTLAVTALIDTAFELLLLKWAFKTKLSGVRISTFLMANVVTASILFASLLPSEVWNRTPKSEIEDIEEYYSLEIGFMQQLLMELPDAYEKRKMPFNLNDDWQSDKWSQADHYRFVELWVTGPSVVHNLQSPAYSEELRFESRYKKGSTFIRKGFLKYHKEYSIKICQYQITSTKNDQKYKVWAIFDLTNLSEDRER